MSDPKRLLDDWGAGSDAGSLLRAMRTPEAPSLEKQAELVQRMLTPIAAPVAAGIGLKAWLGAGAALFAVGAVATYLLWPPAEPAPPVKPPLAPAAVSAPHVAPPSLPSTVSGHMPALASDSLVALCSAIVLSLLTRHG